MDDLVQFLRNRLDEDERIARAAHAPNWSTDGRRGLHYGVEDGWMTDALTTGDANHIARHDPARVLHDVEAARKRLTALADAIETGHDSYDLAAALLPYELLPYADHPDYRDEWRP